jgi:hypothetical protein
MQVKTHWIAVVQAALFEQAVTWLQHFWARQLPQAVPFDGQLAAPQTPFVHWPLQQSEACVHVWPSGLHCGAPQTPFVHCLLQHWLLPLHVPPSGLQSCVQVPLLQMPEQH